jgi:hypothetical protein
MAGCAVTRLDDICRRAIRDANVRPGRAVAYVPDRAIDAVGCWRAPLLSGALSLLVEEVLTATKPAERVELRWRVDDDAAVVRLRYPRPIGTGDRLVTFFDADASACEDRTRLVGAREALLEHGGTLARVRTLRGTTYVATVPRCEASRALRDVPSVVPDEAAEILAMHAGAGPAISIYVGGGARRLRRLHGLMERATELLAEWSSPEDRAALLRPIAAIARSDAPPPGPVAFLRNRDTLLVLYLAREVPDMVAVGGSFDTAPVAEVPFTIWRHVRESRQRSLAGAKTINSNDHVR